MYILICKLIIYSAVAQFFIDMVTGKRFEFFIAGRYWQPMQISMVIVLYCWIFMYVLTKKSSFYKIPKIGKLWKVLFVSCIGSILWGVYNGFGKGYIGFWGDSEVLFWIVVSIVIGYSVNRDEKKIYLALQSLKKVIILFTTVGIVYGIQKNFLGLSIFGIVHFNEYFLLAFFFFVFFNDVIITGSRKKIDIWGLYLIAIFLIVNFHKAIILSSFCVSLVVIFLTQKENKSAKKKPIIKLMKKILIPGIVTILLAIMLTDTMQIESVKRFARYQWTERILHESTGDISAGRFDLWKFTFNIVEKEPLRGAGVGFRVEEEYDRKTGESTLKVSNTGINVHNHWIYFFGALGIPGALIIITTFISYLFLTALTIKQKYTKSTDVACFIPWWSFSFMLSIFGLFGLWNISPVGFILFGFSIGFTLKVVSSSKTILLKKS